MSNKITSSSLAITDDVGNAPTALANGAYTNDSALTFSGVAAASGGLSNSTLKIWMVINGGAAVALGTAAVNNTTGSWSFSAPVQTTQGSYAYYVTDGGEGQFRNFVPLTSGGTSVTVTLDTIAPSAPAAPGVAENSAGGINLAEAADGSVVAVSLAGTGAIAGDTVRVKWGSQSVDYTLTAADVSGGSANVTVGASTISTQGDGTFNVTASVIDHALNLGASSSATSVKVDRVGPALTVSGGDSGNGTATLSGSVSDSGGLSKVEVYEGQNLLGTANVVNGTWSYATATLSSGSHNFTAKAIDLAGNSTTGSATVLITLGALVTASTFVATDNVGNAPEPVTGGGSSNDNLLQFSGTATIAGSGGTASLKIWADSGDGHGPALLATVSVDAATGAWSFTASSPAADGLYAYYVTDGSRASWDAAAAVPLNGSTQPFYVELDTVAPQQPTLDAVDVQTLTLSGWAEPASIVQIFNGSELLTTDARLDNGPIIADGLDGHWQYTFPAAGLPAGHYDLAVKAVDAAGNTSLASASSAIDIETTVTASTLVVTDDAGNTPAELASGGYSNDSLLEFSGTASVAAVEGGSPPSLKIWADILDGNAPALVATVAVDATTGHWSFAASSPASDNLYAYYVTDGHLASWDAAKAIPLNGAADPFYIQLDTLAPDQPSITSADGLTLTLSGFAEPASTVQIFNGSELLTTDARLADTGPIIADGLDGHWEYTFAAPRLPTGHYDFNVKAIDAAGNTSIASAATAIDIDENAVCFLKGTRLRTPGGQVAVEELKIGDLVSTSSGRAQAIRWIGRRSYVTRFVASHNRPNVLPIRIDRGALADNVPERDLFVSPEHALCLDGALIPARHLVNGRSISYCESLETVEYYHIELPRHDVLIAEGAAAESWLDCGNRNFFMNVVDYLELGLPDQPPGKSCLPFVKEGPVLQKVRATLLARATAFGYETTVDPAANRNGLSRRRHPRLRLSL